MTVRRTATPALDGGGSVRQSVALVAALLLAMMLAPAVATAAGNLVSIVDPSTGAKAHVSDGKLQVGDGTGPLTVNGNVNVGNLPNPQPIAGNVNVQQAPGAAPLDVGGTVSAVFTATAPIDVAGAVDVQNTVSGRQVIAQDPWNNFIQGNNVETLTLFPPPAATTDLAVTSFTIMNTGDVPATITVETASKSGGSCQLSGGTLTEFSVGPNSTSHVEYPQPLVAHLTTNQCVLAEVNGDGATRITGVGFTQ